MKKKIIAIALTFSVLLLLNGCTLSNQMDDTSQSIQPSSTPTSANDEHNNPISTTASSTAVPVTSAPHTHTYTTEIIEPTCSSPGYTIHRCVDDDDYYIDSETEALGHNWVEGERNYSCSRCNRSEAEGFSFKLATSDGESCYVITDADLSQVDISNGVLEVPRKYESLPVLGIMPWAFSNVTQRVKTLVIHDNIKYIYHDIWHGSGIWTPDWEVKSSLETIVFDDTCNGITIDAGAFNNCPNLRYANISKGMIKSVPTDAVRGVNGGTGEFLFNKTPYFAENAVIKNGLYYIADLLLYADLNEISSNVVIDEGTVFINPCIFAECTFIKSVIIPKSVKIIGNSAFDGCRNLETISYQGTVNDFDSIAIDVSAFCNTKASFVSCTNGRVTEYYYNGWTYEIGGDY